MINRQSLRSVLFGVVLLMLLAILAVGLTHSTAEAQANVLTLNVISARSELNAPGGPVFKGDPVTQYKYLINIDNTGNPTQAKGSGCSVGDAGYPDSCDWPSVREVPGAAPIFTQGNQDDFGVGLNLPDGKYLVSVLADGYKMGGTHFTVPLAGPVDVELQPHPLPSATMRIRVFEDISPINGQFDAPGEFGLSGFYAIIKDPAGDLSTDVFGNPLCTEYDANGDPIPGTGTTACLYSDANGDIVVPNLGPNRYDVEVAPPSGQGWVRTTTLEGSWSWDSWLAEGGTGLDNEFVVAGEPFPWTMFGYVKEQNNLAGGSGGVTGTIVGASIYLPQQNGLPYQGGVWGGLNGTKVTGPIEDAWVALSDLQNGDTAVYVGRADTNGNFNISGVPNGNYLFTWWDDPLHHILDWTQITVSNGQVYDMGAQQLTGWFTKIDGYVFNDLNKNGKKDAGESGVPNYLVVLRDRDNSEIDRMSIAVTTDATGYYVLERAYPMGSWMVLEAYNDRYYGTGITYQVENQPTPTTVLGNGVDVGVLPILGQSGRLDWGVHLYEAGTNGGIVGSVFYETTRNEFVPQYEAVEPWSPGVPGLTMNLYPTVPCGPTSTACDPSNTYEIEADGSLKKGELLNQTTTEVWEQPVDCTARDANGTPLPFPDVQEVLPPATGGHRCLEGPLMGTQFQSGFATLDGNWGFSEGCFGVGGAVSEGVCADNSDPIPLPSGDYLVEMDVGLDARGLPAYKVVSEETVNVFGGDQYIPAVPPPACAGALHTVDVAGVGTDGPNAVDNPSFAAEGGSPFEGMDKPYCDVKLVNLGNGKSIAPTFNVYTDVPIPGKWKGYIIDDLALSTDPTSLTFGEKAGLANAPIGIYDFNNRLVTTITSDYNGTYEVLLPSTHTVNCPSPSGVCASMYYLMGNDPGQPGAQNANYNPQYRTIGASFEIWTGLLTPSDLAPTQMVVGVIDPATTQSAPADCSLPVTTPQLFAVSQPYLAENAAGSFTIWGQGFGTQGPNSAVKLGNNSMTATSWSDTQIVVDIPRASMPVGPYQLSITNDTGDSTINGLTFHYLGAGYNPEIFEVGPGRPFATIQAGVDAASASNSALGALVVVYPGIPEQWNPNGVYFENVIINKSIKLQGVGPGGVGVLGSAIDGRGVAGDTGYADQWRALVQGLNWDGNQNIYEGPVIYILAEDGEFVQDVSQQAIIDGFTIQGGDQQGFPNNLGGNGVDKTPVAVQGGGIFANSYARYLQITNNEIRSNGGAYAGGIRLGTPHLPGALNDNQNDFVRIANNRIHSNGGTNLAGAVGIFSGAQGYEVSYNDICGNFSAEYGGGISHYGYSPNSSIHNNRIYFNRGYDEGGGVMIAGELPANPATLSTGAGAVDVYANLIQANLANDDGGGLRFLMAGNFPYNVYNNIIVNNISTHEGGGVSLNDAPNVRVFNNTIMKNITTATAVTSNGLPAPAGLSSSQNSAILQATLPGGSSIFSNPLLFNNIFWDNRAGTWTGGGISGIGQAGDPNPINNWDLGVADGTGLLSPTSSLLQVTTGTVLDGSNIMSNPFVVNEFDVNVQVLPWRGNANFIDPLIVALETRVDLLGDFHLQSASPAIDSNGVTSKAGIGAPSDDIDGDPRPAANIWDIGADEAAGAVVIVPPLAFSTVGNGVVPGVPAPYDDADGYMWDNVQFSRVLDASLILPGNANIDGVAFSEGIVYISFSRNGGTNIPGLGVVQDEDVVQLNPATMVWQPFFVGGTACGLNASNGQDVDAVEVINGILYFSTVGNNAVAGVAGPYDDADIYTWNGTSCGRFFDASASGLPGNANVDGYSSDGTQAYFSFAANGGTNIPGIGPVQDEDVVHLDATSTWTLFFDGSAHGLGATNSQDLDAIYVP